jgi:hypothetical protein
VAVAREYVKALIDRLTDEQVEALRVIVESMVWPTEKSCWKKPRRLRKRLPRSTRARA